MQAILMPTVIVSVIGIIAGVILSAADKYISVPVDERVSNVRDILPGANCGACGFAGCDEYADKLVNEDAATNLCTPGGQEVAKQISGLLGKSFASVEEKQAVVKCSGTCGSTENIMDYSGIMTCEANNYFYQGRGSCTYTCLGFGDCVRECQYDALHIEDGIAVVDYNKCTGCGMCAPKCPNVLISIIPKKSRVFVGCSSNDKGAYTRKICSAGCIGCKKCEKTCKFGAIIIKDNLAGIDPEKCTNCGECAEVCPTKVIRVMGLPEADSELLAEA